MSYTRQYIVRMDFRGHSYTAIVSSGNSLGAIHKFLLHMEQLDSEEINHKPCLADVNTHFTKVNTFDDGTKMYSNDTIVQDTLHHIDMFISKINPISDFTFVNEI